MIGSASQTGAVLLLIAILVSSAVALLLPLIAEASFRRRRRVAPTPRRGPADPFSEARDAMMDEVRRLLDDRVLVHQARRTIRASKRSGHGRP